MTSTDVDHAITHWGPKRAASREALCTPTTIPSEFTANSNPYCCGLKPYVFLKGNDDAERYENNPLKVIAPMMSTPMNTRSLSTLL